MMTRTQTDDLREKRARARRLMQLRALGYDPDVLSEAQLARVLASMAAHEARRRLVDDLTGWCAFRVLA